MTVFFPILNLAFFMKIFSVRQTVLPALLVLSPVVFAADEQTMIVSAAPQVVSELDTQQP
ncbi:TonB-dependent receptor [Escherichia coli]|uniref:TonB-dependent receptor n=1 Tax=Escherichia coli TaxID=562 RepID=A0A376LPA6_ECOLX|nr:TonB-dependent receptor [Escherichia coli]